MATNTIEKLKQYWASLNLKPRYVLDPDKRGITIETPDPYGNIKVQSYRFRQPIMFDPRYDNIENLLRYQSPSSSITYTKTGSPYLPEGLTPDEMLEYYKYKASQQTNPMISVGAGIQQKGIPYGGGYLTPGEYAEVNRLMQEKVKQEYEQKYQEAKEANERRYQEILKGLEQTAARVGADYDTLYQEAMQRIQGLTDKQIEELRRQYEIANKQQMFGLAQAGLYNTTVAPTIQRQNVEAAAREEGLVRERARRHELDTMLDLKKSRIGALTDLDLQKYGVMERREDVYPSVEELLMLSRGLGDVPLGYSMGGGGGFSTGGGLGAQATMTRTSGSILNWWRPAGALARMGYTRQPSTYWQDLVMDYRASAPQRRMQAALDQEMARQARLDRYYEWQNWLRQNRPTSPYINRLGY